MTVYVDDMYTRAMGQFNQMKMSHMISDTEEELHKMAKTIGVKKRWFQGDHYDVSISKRKLALREGAVPITLRQCSQMSFVRRVTGKLPPPREAYRRWQKVQERLRVPPRKKVIPRIRFRERLR